MKRAILMSRVSSDEQAKGYSLDIQVEKLQAHSRKENIDVVNVFKEDHSAKDFNRPEFKKFLQFVTKNKNKVDLLLVVTWDRFSRNVSESYAMITTLKGLGIEVQAIEQPLDLSIPENLLILGVYLSLPDIDNRRRSIKIKEGVRAAKAAGRWLGPAPYGYSNAKDDINKPIIIPNAKAEIVKKIFTNIAVGDIQSEVRYKLNKEGNYISESSFAAMIRNPVYKGQIFVTANTKNEGYYVNGLHTPLISADLFEKVQDKLAGNLKAKKKVDAKSFQAELALRGLLDCDNCGHHLTGSASKSRSGVKHYYYHCNYCGKVRIRAADVHHKIESILDEISIKKNAKILYDSIIKTLLTKNVSKKRPQEKIEDDIRQLELRIRNTEDNLADGKIDAATFNNSLNRYKQMIRSLKSEFLAARDTESDYTQYLKKGIDLLGNMRAFYSNADIMAKRKLIGSTFPDNLIFSKEKCRTASINKAILLIMNTDKGSRKQKTDVLFKNLMYTGTVESIGVEPTTSCMPCKRSSQLS